MQHAQLVSAGNNVFRLFLTAKILSSVESANRAGLEFCIPPSEVPMPHYEYFCNSCKKTFSKMLSISEHDKEKAACPRCGSKNVEQRWSAFSAVTSKKSA